MNFYYGNVLRDSILCSIFIWTIFGTVYITDNMPQLSKIKKARQENRNVQWIGDSNSAKSGSTALASLDKTPNPPPVLAALPPRQLRGRPQKGTMITVSSATYGVDGSSQNLAQNVQPIFETGASLPCRQRGRPRKGTGSTASSATHSVHVGPPEGDFPPLLGTTPVICRTLRNRATYAQVAIAPAVRLSEPIAIEPIAIIEQSPTVAEAAISKPLFKYASATTSLWSATMAKNMSQRQRYPGAWQGPSTVDMDLNEDQLSQSSVSRSIGSTSSRRSARIAAQTESVASSVTCAVEMAPPQGVPRSTKRQGEIVHPSCSSTKAKRGRPTKVVRDSSDGSLTSSMASITSSNRFECISIDVEGNVDDEIPLRRPVGRPKKAVSLAQPVAEVPRRRRGRPRKTTLPNKKDNSNASVVSVSVTSECSVASRRSTRLQELATRTNVIVADVGSTATVMNDASGSGELRHFYSKLPIGLQNIGNTCFLNSTIQCLFAMSDFLKYLFNNSINDNVKTLLKNIYSTKSHLDLSRFKTYLGELEPRYRNHTEEDAHEAFIFILGHCSALNCLLYKFSIVCNINCYICNLHHVNVNTYNTFYLNWNRPCSMPLELHDLLQQHLNSVDQRLPDCPHTPAVKSLIQYLPNIIIFYLNRFQIDQQKNTDFVNFPLVTFDLKKFTVDEIKYSLAVTSYKLIAVVNHHGNNIDCGHFTSTIKHNNRWYECNDIVVTEIQRNQVVTNLAYFLVYEKMDVPQIEPLQIESGANIQITKTNKNKSKNVAPHIVPSETTDHSNLHQIDSERYGNIITPWYENMIKRATLRTCTNCNERFPTVYFKTSSIDVCFKCKSNKDLLSTTNDMDPGIIPDELDNLTEVEKLVISPAIPTFTIKRLCGEGHTSYSGHNINFPHDITEIINQLPRLKLPIIVVAKKGAKRTVALRIRRAVVLRAIIWLINNNPIFKSNNIKLDRAALNQLPEDGEFEGVTIIEDDHLFDEWENLNGEESESRQIDVNIQFNDNLRSEESSRINSLKKILKFGKVDFEHPLNEFTTCGMEALLFPYLFPYGTCCYRPAKGRKISFVNTGGGLKKYFVHLIQYKDQRFSKDSKFRFYACNQIQRWRGMTSVRVLMKGRKSISVEYLQNNKKNMHEIINDIYVCASVISGSRSYWTSRRHELQSMVEQIGLPTFFVTLSSADLYWFELSLILNCEQSWKEMAKHVTDNPIMVDAFITKRFENFLNQVIYKLFPCTDHFAKVEYQNRGSVHFHMLLWLSDAPDVENRTTSTASIAKYIDKYISAWNNAKDKHNATNNQQHPCSIPFNKIDDYHKHGDILVDHCNRHTKCRPNSCLRIVKGKKSCRYGFPKALSPTTIVKRTTGNELEVTYARNDTLINCFNMDMEIAWNANSDIQFCFNRTMICDYLVKYATKCEPRSSLVTNMCNIISEQSVDSPVLTTARKLMNKLIAAKDMSAMETGHVILGLPYHFVSREFINISTSDYRMLGSKGSTFSNRIDVYCRRNTDFEESSMTNFFKLHDIKGSAKMDKSKQYITVRRPHIRKNESSQEYCRQYVILNTHFRNLDSIKKPDETWCEIYQRLYANIDHNIEINAVADNFLVPNDDMPEDTSEVIADTPNPDWTVVCDRENNDDGLNDTCSVVDQNECDEWMKSKNLYDHKELELFIESERRFYAIPKPQNTFLYENLNVEQRTIYDFVTRHFNNRSTTQISAIIRGFAGCGKSTLLKCIVDLLGDSCIVLAPTGASAFNIHGVTIHSGLKISVTSFCQLGGNPLLFLEKQFKSIRYVFIDEFSMLQQSMMGKIDNRLKQIKACDEVMGGLSFFLIGDLAQLPAVMDVAVWHPIIRGKTFELRNVGYNVYSGIPVSFTLSGTIRQTDRIFANILNNLRNGKISFSDWEILRSRCDPALINSDEFSNSVRLFPTRKAVKSYNISKLCSLGRPICKIKSVDVGTRRNSIDPQNVCNLEKFLTLSVGARVMLVVNIWVESGLVNSAIGTVRNIIFKDPPPSLPTSVMVEFDNFRGPTIDNCVPITPISRSTGDNEPCTRKQIPLQLAFAMTIHKSQGLTLDKAVIDIGPKESPVGLTYTALSRVRRLEDLALYSIDFSRLRNIHSLIIKRLEEECRLDKLKYNSH